MVCSIEVLTEEGTGFELFLPNFEDNSLMILGSIPCLGQGENEDLKHFILQQLNITVSTVLYSMQYSEKTIKTNLTPTTKTTVQRCCANAGL